MPRQRQPNPESDGPRLAIRRHTDRCFHEVEEVVYRTTHPDGPGTGEVLGYIIDGVMIDPDDVAEVRPIE